MKNEFSVPPLMWFQNKAKYSGGKRSKKRNDFNFRIEISETLDVDVWYGLLIFDLSEPVNHSSFEITEAGYEKMLIFIDECYLLWREIEDLT
ncbi:MAG: hypothetical protein LBM87_04655 [Ruminococcus sp.]|jgi:hypothetical protein|nr:hypothetical protein [Ruminococcus sp.]